MSIDLLNVHSRVIYGNPAHIQYWIHQVYKKSICIHSVLLLCAGSLYLPDIFAIVKETRITFSSERIRTVVVVWLIITPLIF